MEERSDQFYKNELIQFANNIKEQVEQTKKALNYFERRKFLQASEDTLNWVKIHPEENGSTYLEKKTNLEKSLRQPQPPPQRPPPLQSPSPLQRPPSPLLPLRPPSPSHLPPLRLSSPPLRSSSPPLRSSSPPLRSSSPPLRLSSPPLRSSSPPLRLSSPPLRSSSPPLRSSSPPLRSSSPPLRSSSPPLRSSSPPLRLSSPPLRLSSPPLRLSSPPLRSSSPPLRSSSPPLRSSLPPLRSSSPPRRRSPRPLTPQQSLILRDEEMALRLQEEFFREDEWMAELSQIQPPIPEFPPRNHFSEFFDEITDVHDNFHEFPREYVHEFPPRDQEIYQTERGWGEGDDEEIGENLSYEQLLQLGERIGKVGGVSNEELSQLPVFVWHGENLSDKTCGICLSMWEKNELVRRLTCLHTFHKDCIDPWLKENQTCPICKYDVRNY